MDKVVQPKKTLKLTEAEKKVLSAYASFAASEGGMKPLRPSVIDKKLVN